MKLDKETLLKLIKIISDDYMHWPEEEIPFVLNFCSACDFYIYPDDKGCIGWLTIKDIDCKLKTIVLVFYVKPEYRGTKIFFDMLERIEQIAKDENATEIQIGPSISGYKEEKFNEIFARYGYETNGYKKRIQ